MNQEGKLIVFSAPSGSGKTSIVNQLLKIPELKLAFSKSATSRPKRGNEKEGISYIFLSKDDFLKKIKNQEFIEWEEVYKDTFYGTLKSEIQRIWGLKKNIIFDIDVQGGIALKKLYPKNTLTIFVKPPSLSELENRLRNRGTDSEEKIKERLEKAEIELNTISQFDKVIINETLEVSVLEATELIKEFILEK